MDSGKITAIMGTTRSGKSQYTKRALKGEPRVMIWDVKEEYEGVARAFTRDELINLVKSGAPKIAYTTGFKSNFDYFCRCAKRWFEDNYKAGRRCVLVFEETADVTNPAKAPEHYGMILRKALSSGVDIYAITQRPAESDKTAIGNASVVHICRMQLDRDRKSVARDTGVPLSEIEALRADKVKKVFDYIHADTGVGQYHTGQLTFRRGKAVFNDNNDSKPL